MKISAIIDLTCQTCGKKWSQSAEVDLKNTGEVVVKAVCPNAENHEPEPSIIEH